METETADGGKRKEQPDVQKTSQLSGHGVVSPQHPLGGGRHQRQSILGLPQLCIRISASPAPPLHPCFSLTAWFLLSSSALGSSQLTDSAGPFIPDQHQLHALSWSSC